MMAPERIYLVIEPSPNPRDEEHSARARRGFNQYDRFAKELEQNVETPVEILEVALKEAPRDGMLLVDYWNIPFEALRADGESAKPGEARPIVLGMSSGNAFSWSEVIRPAAVVFADRMGEWEMGDGGGYPVIQLYGLKILASKLAPMLKPWGLGETEHYCSYIGQEIPKLPALVAYYIKAYWQSLRA